ncbi:MAG TPA: cation:proton antiporter [Gaiellaceae bacterium]|nr:cation:proton antiporter [Gaiellaceae bacterium]
MDSWSLAVVAALVLGYAGVSRRLERSVVSAAMVFVAGGLVAGPEVLGWFDLEVDHQSVRVLAEATLTVVLFADASRIDIGALRREYELPVRLLGIGLPLTIIAGTLAAVVVVSELTWLEALVLAIVLAPTDAALGQAVVTDRRLPSRVRQGLNVESGLNDGICVPLLFIALAAAEADEDILSVSGAAHLVLEEIGYGIVGGIVAGAAGAYVIRFAERRGLVDEDWLQVIPLAAAALAYGIAAPLGGSGFIAAFVGGFVFGAIGRDGRSGITYVTDATGLTLAGVTFVVFGAVALGPALGELDLQVALYAVLSLTAVRMVPVAVSLLGMHARPPTVGFVAWFGPRGLASIVFAVLVLEGSQLEHVDTMVVAAAITVALSVVAHGLTAVPLTVAYAQWFAGQERPTMESKAAPEIPWRRQVGPVP